MNWRRLNNIVHRDLGYLAVGLTIVYGISGLAVNHKADWNPSYRVRKTVERIEPITATTRDEIVREARQKLGVAEEPLQHAHALEEEPLVLLVGDPDAAEELQRVLLHEPAADRELQLGRRDLGLALRGVFRSGLYRR